MAIDGATPRMNVRGNSVIPPGIDFTSAAAGVSSRERGLSLRSPPLRLRVRSSHLAPRVALLLACATAASGCRIRDRDEPEEEVSLSAAEQEIVDDSTSLDETTQDGSALAAIPTLPLLLGEGPLTLAAAVERQQLGARLFLPVGCATATAAGNVVTYEFDGCTGSYGLVALRGRQIATFRPGPTEGSTSIDLRSEDLTLNGRAVEHEAEVTLRFTNAEKQVAWKGSFTTTGRRGLPIEHAADLRLVLDDTTRCSTLDGTTTGAVAGRGLELVYTGLEACSPRGSCLAGRIDATGLRSGLSVGIELDGSSTAVVTTPRGAEVDLQLPCTPRGEGP